MTKKEQNDKLIEQNEEIISDITVEDNFIQRDYDKLVIDHNRLINEYNKLKLENSELKRQPQAKTEVVVRNEVKISEEDFRRLENVIYRDRLKKFKWNRSYPVTDDEYEKFDQYIGYYNAGIATTKQVFFLIEMLCRYSQWTDSDITKELYDLNAEETYKIHEEIVPTCDEHYSKLIIKMAEYIYTRD